MEPATAEVAMLSASISSTQKADITGASKSIDDDFDSFFSPGQIQELLAADEGDFDRILEGEALRSAALLREACTCVFELDKAAIAEAQPKGLGARQLLREVELEWKDRI